ncbi:MAG: hypothetical protein IT168_20405 [Bryobacterales bacterium]|nr:hypothetical protein [Bryobacterales bacterium]
MDRDDVERIEEKASQSRVTLSQGRAGGAGSPEDDPRHSRRHAGLRPGAGEPLSHERTEVRHGRHRYEWSEVEREMLAEVGRFRTMDEHDIERVFYRGCAKQFRQDAEHLSRQGLLLRRSVVVGKNHDIRHIVVLSKKAKKLLQHQRALQPAQAIYAGFVKPAEVSHDASIYRMYEAEAAHIEAAGGRVSRVVLDFEFKRKIYSELNKDGDYGDVEYARRQEELARLHDLPVVDGKISLPDLRIEYEAADGSRAHIDLELATENYRPGHMSQKTRAGFKMYGVNSTSRGHRAEWEGRELTADVLAL